jgi:hypothetical protein
VMKSTRSWLGFPSFQDYGDGTGAMGVYIVSLFNMN